MKRILGLAVAAVLAAPAIVHADDLYNTMGMIGAGSYDSGNGNAISGMGVFGAILDLQLADDFSVPAGGFQIQEVEQASVTYLGVAPQDLAIRIYADNGGTPDNTAMYEALAVGDLGATLTMTPFQDGVFGLQGQILTVSGLSLDMAEGTYWVDLQPIDLSDGGDWFFQARDLDVSTGGAVHFRDGDSGYDGGYGTSEWTNITDFYGAGDAAMRLSGVVPEPATVSLIAVGALLFARRRS